uniref:EF-hand domain-containing protein n=1 Tax=Knipowitschia caucasica TaxID=637954 RepID=A0AAV2M5H1_KNICA
MALSPKQTCVHIVFASPQTPRQNQVSVRTSCLPNRRHSQIQEFKEAFNMIDQNRDGFIDKEDLHDMLASLGKNPSDEYLEGMMAEAPGPINFTMFLTMFGERLNGTDPEDVIRNAFACFDEEGSGVIHEEHLRELLTTMGDRFTDEEVDELFREAPIDKKGNFNYAEFTRILKHGAKDKDDE